MAYIYYVTHIQFDHGAISTLKAECERVGIQRPMIVTDKGVRAAGIVDKAIAALGMKPSAVFDDVPSNPNEAAVQAGLLAYREGNCDGLIAVGGGSAIDCAKGIELVPKKWTLRSEFYDLFFGDSNGQSQQKEIHRADQGRRGRTSHQGGVAAGASCTQL